MKARTFWPLIAILIAFVVGGVLTYAFGNDPILAYRALVGGAFGNLYSIASTLTVTLPLAITGLAVAFSFRSGLFNIGAGGQYWLGGIAAAWVGYAVSLPPVIHIVVAMLAGALAGALWAAVVPGLAKAYRGAHEVITTLMMTYIATLLGHYLVEGGPMQQPGFTPQSPPIRPSAIIATLVPGTQLTWAIFLVPLLAAVLFGALDTGASQMQIVANVPFNLAGVIQGIIIFFIASEGLLRYFQRRRVAPSTTDLPTATTD